MYGTLEAGSPGLFSSGMDGPEGGGGGGGGGKKNKKGKKEGFLFNDGSPAREVAPGRYSRHVIGCHVTREARVSNTLDEVAGNIWPALA